MATFKISSWKGDGSNYTECGYFQAINHIEAMKQVDVNVEKVKKKRGSTNFDKNITYYTVRKIGTIEHVILYEHKLNNN